MNKAFPQRPFSHQLETKSRSYFRQCLPVAWTNDEPQNDYGFDIRVQIADENYLTGMGFVVQLKASQNADAGDTVKLTIKVSTLNFLRSMLEVAILVKYIEAENEAYWLFLKDVPEPKNDQSTVTVAIPRVNRLSANPWPEIQGYVTKVHYKKLGAMQSANSAAV